MSILFERKRHRITDLKTKEVTTHKSINSAKRFSRAIQRMNGGSGAGAVKVIK